jgi:hypothetical protein
MDEEKTTSAPPPRGGCFFCSVMPVLQHRWREATRGHFRNSRVEFLKGIRSLLDDRISRLSAEERKGTHVNVD